MRRFLIALALLWPTCAWAQCTGVFPAGYICGNPSAFAAPPGPNTTIAFSSAIATPAITTSGQVPTFGNTTGTQFYDPTSISTNQSFTLSGGLTSSGVTSLTGIVNITSQFQISGVRFQFPASTDTVGGLSTTQTWTGANTFTSTFTATGSTFTITGSTFTNSIFSTAIVSAPTANFLTVTASTYTAGGGTSCTSQSASAGACVAGFTSQAIVATTNSLSVVTGTTTPFVVNSVGHFLPRTAAVSPAASCAGGVAAANSTDQAGQVTMTSATTCNVFFANAYAIAPFCHITPNTSVAATAAVTTFTTGFTVTLGTSENAFNYLCMGL